jgi:hypothetical protein
MPQVSLYLNDKTYAQVRKAAEAEAMSVSKWVAEKLNDAVARDWPNGFDQLFGCIADDTFKAPEREAFDSNAARETL